MKQREPRKSPGKIKQAMEEKERIDHDKDHPENEADFHKALAKVFIISRDS